MDLKASSEGADVSQKQGGVGGGHDHEAAEGKLSGGVTPPPFPSPMERDVFQPS